MIIGTRFIKKKRVIFLQPQVAKLTGSGNIDMSTSRWLDLPDIQHPRQEDLVEITYASRRHIRCGTFELDNDAFVTGIIHFT